MSLEGNKFSKKMWGILDSLGVVEQEEKNLVERQGKQVVKNSRVVNLEHGSQEMKIVVVELSSFDDVQLVADYLKQRTTVVINCEDTEEKTKTRAVDFTSGIIYALGGSIQKISGQIFLCAPHGVDVECGALKDEIDEHLLYRKFVKTVVA